MALNLFKKLLGKKEAKAAKSTKKTAKKKSRPSSKNKKKLKRKPAAGKAASKTGPKKITKKKKVSGKKTASLKQPRQVKEKEIGVITHYFKRISVGIIKLKTPLRAGDKIRIRGAHVDFEQAVKSMQINHEDVVYASKGSEVGVKVKKRVHLNDKVYKKQ